MPRGPYRYRARRCVDCDRSYDPTGPTQKRCASCRCSRAVRIVLDRAAR